MVRMFLKEREGGQSGESKKKKKKMKTHLLP